MKSQSIPAKQRPDFAPLHFDAVRRRLDNCQRRRAFGILRIFHDAFAEFKFKEFFGVVRGGDFRSHERNLYSRLKILLRKFDVLTMSLEPKVFRHNHLTFTFAASLSDSSSYSSASLCFFGIKGENVDVKTIRSRILNAEKVGLTSAFPHKSEKWMVKRLRNDYINDWLSFCHYSGATYLTRPCTVLFL